MRMKRSVIERVPGIILAGGEAKRLWELTTHARRAKAAVPFGDGHRLGDFALSNLENSGIRKKYVISQTYHHSLLNHIGKHWSTRGTIPWAADYKFGDDKGWYSGTANSVWQNLDYFDDEKGIHHVLIMPGDQVSLFDARAMLETHEDSGANLTICLDVVSTEDAKGFGVAVVDSNFRIKKFVEKPDCPETIPGDPDKCYASMGIYIFTLSFLRKMLSQDALNPFSKHDFGGDIIPLALDSGAYVGGHDFTNQVIEGQEKPYFRDVGTLFSYHAAHMDLLGCKPELNTYNEEWPIWAEPTNQPSGKKSFPSSRSDEFSIMGNGSVNDKSCLIYSMLGRNVRVTGSLIERSIILSNVTIHDGCHTWNAIIDKNVEMPPGTHIGFDERHDIERGFRVVDGITLVPKGYKFG